LALTGSHFVQTFARNPFDARVPFFLPLGHPALRLSGFLALWLYGFMALLIYGFWL
jgi:hypothetical protein